MKRILMVVVFVGMIALLVSCGNTVNTSSEAGKELPDLASDTFTEVEKELPDSAPNISQEQSPVTPIDTPSAEEKKIPVKLKEARSFSEGIAWVLFENQNGDIQRGWLHTDGHIDQPFPYDVVNHFSPLIYPSRTALGSDFSGGYSYIIERGLRYDDPDSFLILNQTGEITAQSPDDGSSYVILCGGDGVYLVKQSIRSMTEREDRYGFISGDGVWIYECASCEIEGNHPLSALNVDNPNRISSEVDFSYLGDGIFCSDYRESNAYRTVQKVFYNTNTQQTYRLSKGTIYGNFYDGKMPVSTDGQMFIMNTNFELEPIAIDTGDTVIYSEGIIFTANSHYRGSRYLTDAKFYRSDGSVLVDLSQYELMHSDAEELYRYSDGYAAIIVIGVGGGYYLGIIDMDGNFTFEPKKIDIASNYDFVGTFSSGNIVVCIDDKACIVNVDGDEISSDYLDNWEQIEYYVFYDGFTTGVVRDGTIFNLYYIGIDGDILDTYIIG